MGEGGNRPVPHRRAELPGNGRLLQPVRGGRLPHRNYLTNGREQTEGTIRPTRHPRCGGQRQWTTIRIQSLCAVRENVALRPPALQHRQQQGQRRRRSRRESREADDEEVPTAKQHAKIRIWDSSTSATRRKEWTLVRLNA